MTSSNGKTSALAHARTHSRRDVPGAPSSRILQVTGQGSARTSAVRMATARSGAASSALPMPPLVLKCTGQPMFTSTADT